jgi:hypothetical protein
MDSRSISGIIERALRSAWGLDVHAVRPWAGGSRPWLYEAETSRGRLHANGLPVNDVLATTAGKLYAEAGGHVVFVEPWIRPEPVEWTRERWEEFGGTVGRLHSLPVPAELQGCPSRMEPLRSLESVRTSLRESEVQVPPEYRALMESACRQRTGWTTCRRRRARSSIRTWRAAT